MIHTGRTKLTGGIAMGVQVVDVPERHRYEALRDLDYRRPPSTATD